MKNPYQIVNDFEDCVAEYAGAKHAIAVDCCTNAVFLSAYYLKNAFYPRNDSVVCVPAKTYPSIPMALIHAGWKIKFIKEEWERYYWLFPLDICESAKYLKKNMCRYKDVDTYYTCLSFHLRKPLAISKGGMILTNNDEADAWFRKARYEGREGKPLKDERITMMGWNMTMPVDVAARGLHLMQYIDERNEMPEEEYPDLRIHPIFKNHTMVVK